MHENKHVLSITAAAFVSVLDYLSKLLIIKYLAFGQTFPILGGILHISRIHNTGAGFGMFQNANMVLAGISCAFLVLIVLWYPRFPKENFSLIMLGFIVGGAIGNLISRLTLGYVVDFIDLGWFPAFNVADSAITFGAIGLLIHFYRAEHKSLVNS